MTGPEMLFNSILKYLDLNPEKIKTEVVAAHAQAQEIVATFRNMQQQLNLIVQMQTIMLYKLDKMDGDVVPSLGDDALLEYCDFSRYQGN